MTALIGVYVEGAGRETAPEMVFRAILARFRPSFRVFPPVPSDGSAGFTDGDRCEEPRVSVSQAKFIVEVQRIQHLDLMSLEEVRCDYARLLADNFEFLS
jgi:hypothetical protein